MRGRVGQTFGAVAMNCRILSGTADGFGWAAHISATCTSSPRWSWWWGGGEYILPLSLTNPQRAGLLGPASTSGKQPVNEEQPHLRRRLQRKNISVDPRSQLAGHVGAAPV